VVSNEVVKAWLPMYKPLEKPRLRILCFPSAGSAENIYTGLAVREKQRTPNKLMAWATDAQAEVLAVQYPGREQRRSEPFAKSCQAMAASLLPVVQAKLQEEDVPYVIVAHSCGNWIAYELLRLLRARNMHMPMMLFVSCMASPDIAASAKVVWEAGEGGWVERQTALSDVQQQACGGVGRGSDFAITRIHIEIPFLSITHTAVEAQQGDEHGPAPGRVPPVGRERGGPSAGRLAYL
jgi:hypothetical protein